MRVAIIKSFYLIYTYMRENGSIKSQWPVCVCVHELAKEYLQQQHLLDSIWWLVSLFIYRLCGCDAPRLGGNIARSTLWPICNVSHHHTSSWWQPNKVKNYIFWRLFRWLSELNKPMDLLLFSLNSFPLKYGYRDKFSRSPTDQDIAIFIFNWRPYWKMDEARIQSQLIYWQHVESQSHGSPEQHDTTRGGSGGGGGGAWGLSEPADYIFSVQHFSSAHHISLHQTRFVQTNKCNAVVEMLCTVRK